MGLFNWKSHKPNRKFGYSLKESGNIFLMLFGAVGMVGVIGASTMTVMKGPVKTMAEVTKRTLTENEMIATGKLALIAATQNGGGDCDSDGTVEPIPMSATTIPAFAGGSQIPTTIGVSKQDSWGMPYGYCAWDHGSASCGGNHRTGAPTTDQYVIAIVSAGSDGVFNTSCNDYVDSSSVLLQKGTGSDDIVLGYTYEEAAAAAGGLWNLSDPDTAEIAKKVEISDGTNAQFAFDPTAKTLQIGDGTTGVGKFPTLNTDNIQAYAGAGGTINVDSILSSDQNITTSANLSTTGTGNITSAGDISGADLVASGTLTGNSLDINSNAAISSAGAITGAELNVGSGNITGGTSVLGATTVDSLDSGAGLIQTNGNAEFGDELTDTVTIGGITTIGATLDVTGDTSVSTFDTSGLAQLESLTVTNATNLNGAANLNGNTVIGSDATDTITFNAVAANNFNLNGNEIFGLPNAPSGDSYAASKKYVDDQITAGVPGAETDPEVDDTNSVTGKWCTWDGAKIVCATDTPTETDPQVGTLTAGKWCTTDGTDIDCTSDAPSGGSDTLAGLSCTNGQVAKWNGSAWACAGDQTGSGGGSGGGDGSFCISDDWQARASTRRWFDIASSSDGTKVAAVVRNGGQIYTSTDSGVTWTARESNRNWRSIASSSDGTKLAAIVPSNGQIYTSTDSGVTWTARESNRNWYGITSSADGTKLVAVARSGQIYTSTDSGVTWTARESNRNWHSVASSSDGTKLVASVEYGQIYTSTDSGVTWTARQSSQRWKGIASSSDGTKLAGVVFGGQIYTSTDSGVTWTARQSNRNWRRVGLSSDGTRLIATTYNGLIYVSTDSGVTWTAQAFSRSWYGVAMSEDGTKLYAVAENSYIYASQLGCFGSSNSGGDNLGDHTATQDIDVASNNVININSLEFDALAGDAPASGSGSLSDLSCADGQVAKWDNGGSVWICANDNDTGGTDTLAGLSCTDGQVAAWDNAGSAWVCADAGSGSGGGSGSGAGQAIIDKFAEAGETITPITITATNDKWPDYIVCPSSFNYTVKLALSNYNSVNVAYFSESQSTSYYFNPSTGARANSSNVSTNCGASAANIEAICNNNRCGFFGDGAGGGVADNLGDHTATQTLDMSSNDVDNVSMVGFDSVTGAAAPNQASGSGGGGTDTLAGLSCSDGQVAAWNNGATAWECTTPTGTADNLGDHTATQNIDAASNDVININMLEFDAVAGDAPVEASDTLGGLSCGDGQVAKWDNAGSAWICANDTGGTDTLAGLSCADGEIAKWNNGGSVWECSADTGSDNLGDHTATTDLDMATNNVNNTGKVNFVPTAGDAPVEASDTLGGLNCTDGQAAAWNNTSGLWECATPALGCTRRSSAFGATVTVSCQAGEVLTGGGCSASGSGSEKGIKRSYPSADATWLCQRDDSDITVQAWAVCCSFQF